METPTFKKVRFLKIQIPLNVNINFPQMFSQQVAFLINHIVFLCIFASGGVFFDT